LPELCEEIGENNMNIKEQLEALMRMLEGSHKDIDKLQVAAKLMQLHADLQADDSELPLDVFQAIPADQRRNAVLAYLILIGQTLQAA
jgi:hypothetical protein